MGIESYIYPKVDYSIRKFSLIASDVENNPDTGDFICAGIAYRDNNEIVFNYFTDMEKYNERLLDFDIYGNKIGFYNLPYDEAFFREIVDDSKVLRNTSRIIQIGLDNTEIIDIQNISGIEYSLENWIEYLDMKNKYGIEKVSLDDLYIRVKNDTIATLILFEFIQDYFNNTWKITLKNTIGSCAMEIFICNYLNFKIERKLLDNEIPELERNSLRGGRCEVFYRGEMSVISYDVRSMYVSIMKNCYVPIPDKYKLLKSENELINWRKYYDKYLCILDCTIEVNNQKIAPLPYYCKVDGIKKIIYPVGVFRGTYTNEELKIAEKYGTKIIKVHKMIYYYRKEKLFAKFASDVWDMRVKHNRKCVFNCSKCDYESVIDCYYSKKNPNYNKALDTMCKKVGNSLFGKFSQHVPIVSYYGRESQLPEEYKEFIKDNVNYTTRLYDYFGEMYIDIHSKNKKDSRFTFCCISSFITSYARIYWLETAKTNEENVVYGDTDSIKIKNNGSYIPSGKDLGNFMMEYCKKESFYAPKFYGNKTKGVNKNKDTYMSFDNNLWGYKSFKIKKPYRFRSAIRQNKHISSWEYFIKSIDMYDDKRIWFGEKFYTKGILSKPYYINAPDSTDVNINTKDLNT